jgi:single stranded DNA-binding protein
MATQNNYGDVVKVSLTGRLVKDPILKKSAGGRDFAILRIASNRYTRKGEISTFLDVFVFKDLGNLTKNYGKGDKVAVTGNLIVKDYIGKDNIKRTSISVQAQEISLIEKKKESTQEPVAQEPESPEVMEVADIDELVESAGDIDPNTVDKDIDDVI